MAGTSVSPVPAIFADTTAHGVIIADGYGISINVSSGHLVISDGIGRTRRERRIPRIHGAERLFIHGSTGIISIDAIRWLTDARIPWVHQDHDGRIIATSGPQRTDVRIIRSQALAPGTETGLEITRYLLAAKLAGQAEICRDILRIPGAARMIDDLAAEIPRCRELDDMRTTEGAAAVAYWQSWADRVSVPYSPADMMKVPAHWCGGFPGRDSEIGPEHRHATDVINATLNYAYRVAESECVHACHAVGLHPELGILHTDKPARDSFALDLIETVRPVCDRLILGMLDTGLGIPRDDLGKPAYFDRRWVTETRDGQCRIVAPLTHKLAGFAADIGAVVRPHAEYVARILANAVPGRVTVPRVKSKARKTVAPVSSCKQARLRDGATLADVLPDALWEKISVFLPEPPAGPYGHRKTGRPRNTTLDREAVAVNVCTELLGIPYASLGATVSPRTARARRLEFQWSRIDGVSVWDYIVSEVQGFGHLGSLTTA
jgi:CRISPR-associated endonuclease Cas1